MTGDEERVRRGHPSAGTRRQSDRGDQCSLDVSHAHRLDDIGEELKSSVAALGPKYGLNTGEY